MAGLFCNPVCADEPSAPQPRAAATEFEGVWHERMPAGTRDELQATITFSRDTVTITLNGETRRRFFTLLRPDGSPARLSEFCTSDFLLLVFLRHLA